MPVRAKFKVIRIERSLWRKGEYYIDFTKADKG